MHSCKNWFLRNYLKLYFEERCEEIEMLGKRIKALDGHNVDLIRSTGIAG